MSAINKQDGNYGDDYYEYVVYEMKIYCELQSFKETRNETRAKDLISLNASVIHPHKLQNEMDFTTKSVICR